MSLTPSSAAKACSSHSLFLGQVKHSFGWLDKRSSTDILLAVIARSVLVSTSIPSLTVVTHEGTSLLRLVFESTSSTMHTLHEAVLLTIFISWRSKWHRVGIFTPAS